MALSGRYWGELDILKIGIYGGTFNPPHIGHISSAKEASEQLGLDCLIVVPTGVPPHKTVPSGAPPAEMRMEMVQTAFNDCYNVIISDIEMRNDAPAYTIDTINSIKVDYPGAQFFLLTGTDMFLTLQSWRDSEKLLNGITPAVFSRDTDDLIAISDHSNRLRGLFGAETAIINNSVVDISSSELREMLPRREGARYISDTTYAYIIKNRLYGAKPNWDWLRSKAHSMLDIARIPHVDGCEEEALRLAERWGVDADDAREAAILHDITKKLSPDENMTILEEHDVPVGSLKKNEEKLLHSQTGAILAKTEFGVSERVSDAIRWHTTGKACMTNLEKVIYLADYIEPNRDFDGVDKLRVLAYDDLDKALIMGLEMSIADMNSRSIIPNRTTSDALAYLCYHMSGAWRKE